MGLGADYACIKVNVAREVSMRAHPTTAEYVGVRRERTGWSIRASLAPWLTLTSPCADPEANQRWYGSIASARTPRLWAAGRVSRTRPPRRSNTLPRRRKKGSECRVQEGSFTDTHKATSWNWRCAKRTATPQTRQRPTGRHASTGTYAMSPFSPPEMMDWERTSNRMHSDVPPPG